MTLGLRDQITFFLDTRPKHLHALPSRNKRDQPFLNEDGHMPPAQPLPVPGTQQ
jgi:hypothetical protein